MIGSRAIKVPFAENDRVEEVQIAERDRREHTRRDMSDHHRIHDTHEHQADLHQHDGQRETNRRLQLGLWLRVRTERIGDRIAPFVVTGGVRHRRNLT